MSIKECIYFLLAAIPLWIGAVIIAYFAISYMDREFMAFDRMVEPAIVTLVITEFVILLAMGFFYLIRM